MALNLEGELKGRVALITGSSRGIGRALAESLAQAGAAVAIHASRPSAVAEESLAACRAAGARTCLLTGDLADPATPASLVDCCRRELGGLDILVLNASAQYRRDFVDFDRDEAETVLRVNLLAGMEMIARALPAMREAGWGRVINIGSVQQHFPNPVMAPYGASKAALHHHVRGLAPQIAADGVTVNTVSPGVIDTDRNAQALADPDYRNRILGVIPAGYPGEPSDCCGAVLLLCSQVGRYITGIDLSVDGGMAIPVSPKKVAAENSSQ